MDLFGYKKVKKDIEILKKIIAEMTKPNEIFSKCDVVFCFYKSYEFIAYEYKYDHIRGVYVQYCYLFDKEKKEIMFVESKYVRIIQ